MIASAPSGSLASRPGTVLAGKYRVERVLGQGGMGVVVAATHLQLEELVAVKFMRPQHVTSQESVERFLREARAASKLKNEHVTRVYDVGVLESGEPYMVMELLEGSDLSELLRARGGVMPVAEAAGFVIQTCEALASAHVAGIVHRDLKPQNLFVSRRPDGSALIKVLDFGISKMTTPGVGDGSLTATTAVFGSPHYMSPEQMRSSKDVDGRTDIWSLGVCLYELLTGRVPFEGDSVIEIGAKVLREPPPPPSGLRADLPPGLEVVVLRCLEKRADARFGNVAELAAALQPFAPRVESDAASRAWATLRGSGPDVGPMQAARPAVQVVAAVSGPAAVAPNTATSWGTSRGNSTRAPRWLMIAAGCAGLVVVGGLGVIGMMAMSRSTPSPTTSTTGDPATSAVAAPTGPQPSTATADTAAPPTVAPSAMAPPSASRPPAPVGKTPRVPIPGKTPPNKRLPNSVD